MKRKLSKAEKTRRQEWRNAHLATPSTVAWPARQEQIPKALREYDGIGKAPKVVEVSEAKYPITVLADLFKGTTYRGPYVHVSHKQAFEKRQARRTAKAVENTEKALTYPDGSPIVCELGGYANGMPHN